MNVVAFIFAREGSKGLIGKNLKLLGDKPLIAWSIEHALEVNRIKRVIVSTDSEKIAQVAREYGAETPFLRPAELASDTSPEWLSWKHGLEYLYESDGKFPDAMVSIPSTSPLRIPKDIEDCIDKYEEGNSDIVISVADAHRSPYFNMVKNKKNGFVELVNSPKKSIARRQDSPKVYDITTVCYVARPEFVMKHNSTFEGKVSAIHIPNERSIDIDTKLDLVIAESILKSRGKL